MESKSSEILPVNCKFIRDTKLKLSYLKFGFKYKKERYKHTRKILHHSSSTFFEYRSSLLLEYGL